MPQHWKIGVPFTGATLVLYHMASLIKQRWATKLARLD